MLFQQNLGTPEERLAHLENMLPYLARLTEQQSLFEKVEDLKKQNDSLADDLKGLSAQSKEASAQICSLDKAKQDKLAALQDDLKALSQQLEDQQKKYIVYGNKCENAHLAYDGQIKSLEGNVKELIKLHEQMPTRNDFNSLSESLQMKFAGPLTDVAGLKGCVKDCVAVCDGLAEQMRKLSIDVQAMQSLIDHLGSKQNDLEQDLQKKQAQAICDQDKKELALAQKYDALAKKMESIPVIDVEALKTEMMGILEPIKLEANIAGLRSNNNLGKIAVIEKKIEQLYLLLNK